MGEMRPVPSGCGPKWHHAVLLVIHLDVPNHTPRALPGTILGQQRSDLVSVNRTLGQEV